MKHPMLKGCTLAAAVFLASHATAGGFDNSSRGFDIIYGDNNVISTSYGRTSVPMKAQIEQEAGSGSATVASGEIIDAFERPQVGIRYNINENISCAGQYEVPFAAGVSYQDDELAYLSDPLDPTSAKSAPISTKYDSKSFTFACGYDFALKTGEVKVFGGPKLQEVSGSFDEDITPVAGAAQDNLIVELDGGTEVGYILGAAFSMPEIALRASILYHNQIDYSASGTNTTFLPLSAFGMTDEIVTTNATAKTFTPQTVELNLQSGIAENTLAFIKMRWSEYGKLSTLKVNADESTTLAQNPNLTLGQLNETAQNNFSSDAIDSLINPEVSMFSNDTFDYSFGLGRRINDQLSLGASFSGSIKLGGKSDDTPIGADSTSLRLPGDTSHTVSFGGEYTVIPKLKLNGGLGYTFIDEYRVQTVANEDTGVSSFRAEFDKTEAVSFQMGVTYEI